MATGSGIMIDPSPCHAKKKINIDGDDIAYVDEGVGDPVVFLHGNATTWCIRRISTDRCCVIGTGRFAQPVHRAPDDERRPRKAAFNVV
tara:strand:+ start:2603 stop:2869 length:267 start_codon:yes stop_codon:yes gene_type:complete